jgi:hypothetical protein
MDMPDDRERGMENRVYRPRLKLAILYHRWSGFTVPQPDPDVFVGSNLEGDFLLQPTVPKKLWSDHTTCDRSIREVLGD